MAAKQAAPFEMQMPSDHPLAESLGFALGTIMSQQHLHSAELDVLAVLAAAHAPTFEIVREKLGLQESGSLSAACARFAGKVDYELKTKGDFVRSGREGNPNPALPANLHRLLRILNCELRRNEWLERDEIRGGHEWPKWTHIDDGVLAQLLTEARNHGFQPTDKFMWQTLATFANGNKVDPAIDRLKALENSYDRVPRLDKWLSMVFGVPADTYHRVVGLRIIGGMVRRIREPGCKIDEMAVLIGDQGLSKSKACRMLSPIENGFADGIKLGEESKELILLLAGRAVCEIAEMGKRSSAGIDAIKSMLSRSHDLGRTAYARMPGDRPRRNIFMGTSNENTPLIDVSGNRRFLPVRCERVDLEWLAANVDMLLAEACALQSQGETFDLPEDTWDIAHEHQEAARERSRVELLLEDQFGPVDLNHHAQAHQPEFVTSTALGRFVENNMRGNVSSNTIGAIMGKLGWESDMEKLNAGALRGARLWRRGEWRMFGNGMVHHKEGWPETNPGKLHAVYLPMQNLPPLPY
jgi:hypothetical protein